ncbi:hypothetical protein TIFTF001_029739 [Ficus carica]|uniref:Uncharacterized protein n=1 Tax=Ficus carica TaxID=3494 RepID=A0AA88DS73_FICCA|nr:hypothetical protein TIFTF001_029739 [Ficus carica]
MAENTDILAMGAMTRNVIEDNNHGTETSQQTDDQTSGRCHEQTSDQPRDQTRGRQNDQTRNHLDNLTRVSPTIRPVIRLATKR